MREHDDRLRQFYDVEMCDRASRPLGQRRERAVDAFAALLDKQNRQRVLEVGCGAGRDAVRLAASRAAYVGVDLSKSAVQCCHDLGLAAVEGSATALPFADDSFDAVWSMSTLMHLPGDGLRLALAELARVLRVDSIAEIGVWGHKHTREWNSPDGRYFLQRSDADLRHELEMLGRAEHFNTWGAEWDDGGHYQWARVRT